MLSCAKTIKHHVLKFTPLHGVITMFLKQNSMSSIYKQDVGWIVSVYTGFVVIPVTLLGVPLCCPIVPIVVILCHMINGIYA